MTSCWNIMMKKKLNSSHCQTGGEREETNVASVSRHHSAGVASCLVPRLEPLADLAPAVVLAAREAALQDEIVGEARAPQRREHGHNQATRGARAQVKVPAIDPRQERPEAIDNARVGGALGEIGAE